MPTLLTRAAQALAVTAAILLAPATALPKVLVIVLDGTREETFHAMLLSGELPHLSALLQPDANGERHGYYTAATSVWPSTTGPGYVPFIAGTFPNKSKLSGIRQFLRHERKFRSYAGTDAIAICEDLSREFPTIYEVLGVDDSYCHQGFVARQGWPDGRIRFPKHQVMTSALGVIQQQLENPAEFDWYNLLSFASYVTAAGDYRLIESIEKQRGRFKPATIDRAAKLVAEGLLLELHGMGNSVYHLDLTARKLAVLPRFSFLSLHLPDNTSHRLGPGDAYRQGLAEIDVMLGLLFQVLEDQGALDDVTIFISADHGTSRVEPGAENHFQFLRRLAEDTGIQIHDSLQRITGVFNADLLKTELLTEIELLRTQDWSGVGAISGNANAQIYLKKPGQKRWDVRPDYHEIRNYPSPHGGTRDLVAASLAYPQIALAFLEGPGEGTFTIASRAANGALDEAVIEKRIDGTEPLYSYRVTIGADPLRLTELPAALQAIEAGRALNRDDWARLTRDSNYPDAIAQVVQLLEAENSGDLILDAAPGVEPWNEMQAGLHGALRREHILVPLLIWSRRLDYEKAEGYFAARGLPRTVDVYPTTLALLGLQPPDTISWRERSSKKMWMGLKTVTKSVRKDIDGQILDIFR